MDLLPFAVWTAPPPSLTPSQARLPHLQVAGIVHPSDAEGDDALRLGNLQRQQGNNRISTIISCCDLP